MFLKETSLIIPTLERFQNLRRFFNSINNYISEFNEILIIDSSSDITHNQIIKYFLNHNNIKIIKSASSTSIQRNIGLKSFNAENKFLMFCDDDIIFEKDAFLKMNNFIKDFPNNIGYGFNLFEKQNYNLINNLKKNTIFENYGLYNHRPGIVCDNGWHTKISNLKKDYEVMWLSTQASVYKSKNIKNKFFDDKLGRYSYLEDLFFSHATSKIGKLSVCSKSVYFHPNNIERKDFKFGIQEVVNRYKFVKKFNLSINKFYLTVILKIIYNFLQIFLLNLNIFPKIFGNVYVIFLCMKKK